MTLSTISSRPGGLVGLDRPKQWLLAAKACPLYKNCNQVKIEVLRIATRYVQKYPCKVAKGTRIIARKKK